MGTQAPIATSLLYPELLAALDQPTDPTHYRSEEAHASLHGVMQMVGEFVREFAWRREALLLAELTGDDHDDVQGDLERLHQTLGAAEKDATTLIDTLRRLALHFSQYDRYAAEIKTSRVERQVKLDAIEAAATAATVPGVAQPVTSAAATGTP